MLEADSVEAASHLSPQTESMVQYNICKVALIAIGQTSGSLAKDAAAPPRCLGESFDVSFDEVVNWPAIII